MPSRPDPATPFTVVGRYLPGIMLATVIAVAASFVSEHYGGPKFLYALLIGIAFHFLSDDARCVPGIEFSAKKLVRIGVALLGARIVMADVSALGLWGILGLAGAVILTMSFGVLMARALRLPPMLGLLSGGGTGICGISATMAISATMPQTAENERNTLMTAIGIASLSTVVMVLYPLWVRWLDMSVSPTDNNSSRPTGRQWDETAPSESPTSPQPSDGRGRPTACPIARNPSPPAPQDNWFYSGGIRYQGVPGWRTSKANYIDFASERSGQDDHVTESWVAVTAIGQLSKTDYSADTRIAAKQLISCLSTSYYYKYLDRVESLEDKSFRTADGVEGWLIRANFWNKPGHYDVLGDEVVVVILDQGAPNTITLFHTQAPIGDSARQEMVKKSLDSLGRG